MSEWLVVQSCGFYLTDDEATVTFLLLGQDSSFFSGSLDHCTVCHFWCCVVFV